MLRALGWTQVGRCTLKQNNTGPVWVVVHQVHQAVMYQGSLGWYVHMLRSSRSCMLEQKSIEETQIVSCSLRALSSHAPKQKSTREIRVDGCVLWEHWVVTLKQKSNVEGLLACTDSTGQVPDGMCRKHQEGLSWHIPNQNPDSRALGGSYRAHAASSAFLFPPDPMFHPDHICSDHHLNVTKNTQSTHLHFLTQICEAPTVTHTRTPPSHIYMHGTQHTNTHLCTQTSHIQIHVKHPTLHPISIPHTFKCAYYTHNSLTNTCISHTTYTYMHTISTCAHTYHTYTYHTHIFLSHLYCKWFSSTIIDCEPRHLFLVRQVLPDPLLIIFTWHLTILYYSSLGYFSIWLTLENPKAWTVTEFHNPEPGLCCPIEPVLLIRTISICPQGRP